MGSSYSIRRSVRVAFLLSSLPLLVATCVLPFLRPQYGCHSLLLLGYLVALWQLVEAAARRRRYLGLALAVSTFNLVVVAPEVALRLIDFRHEAGIQFGYPRPQSFAYLVEDEELFWTHPPGTPGVNSWGFRGPEVSPKPPATARIVVLGDSVPAQGYPEIAGTFLAADEACPAVEVVNLSTGGYSSHQGRVLVERYGPVLDADVAVISYGWNDHWRAWQSIDAEKKVRVRRSLLARFVRRVYHHSRILQLSRRLLVPILGTETPQPEDRVPRERYRENLDTIGRFFAAGGSRVLLVTPPSAHTRVGVPPYLIERGFSESPAEVIVQHREYNRIVRDLVAERGWALLDLEADLEHLTTPTLEKVFLEDGIHFSQHGVALAAELLARATAGLVPCKTD